MTTRKNKFEQGFQRATKTMMLLLSLNVDYWPDGVSEATVGELEIDPQIAAQVFEHVDRLARRILNERPRRRRTKESTDAIATTEEPGIQ